MSSPGDSKAAPIQVRIVCEMSSCFMVFSVRSCGGVDDTGVSKTKGSNAGRSVKLYR